MYSFKVGDCTILLIMGDLTDQDTDAIVNAANPTLMGGGGVDGAIHAKGGPGILEECRHIRRDIWPEGLPTGRAVITTGGHLKAPFVIHTVGPVWKGGHENEAEKLRDAYISSMDMAVENNLKSISFPSISTGAYGFPIKQAAGIVLQTLIEYLSSGSTLQEVRLVLFKHNDLEIYQTAVLELLPLFNDRHGQGQQKEDKK